MTADRDNLKARPTSASDPAPAPSGRRAVPVVEWRDALLDLSIRLPIDAGERPVASAVVDAVHMMLPGTSVGACLVDSRTGQQMVIARGPDESAGQDRDPTRLFPTLAYEHVVVVGGDGAGSTLHVAGDDPGLPDPSSETRCLVERASMVLAAGLARARGLAKARGSNAELTRLQAQVIQAEKLASLGQIVAGVVHELNNPLTSIVAYSDYLVKRARERQNDEDGERLRRIGEAAERILKFSRDLVAYARPTNEIPGPVSLSEVIDKALVFCEHEFSEGRVRVVRALADEMPPVRGIAGQLIQVFVNLFTNAAHAMTDHGGELEVRTNVRPAEDVVLVEIADQGVGIEPEALEQIFEPFFTTKTDGRGTGLGLSIVRKIITSHGGELTARSMPGRGTVFCITLPLALTPP